MAKRSIIRYGDRTTHGGTVISADSTFSIDGKNVARVGDLVSCPRCKGTFPIVTGAPDAWSGQSIARQDDMTACGAKLIASQCGAVIDEAGGSTSLAAVAASASLLAESSPVGIKTHAIRFQALNPETGKPDPKCTYILTRESGVMHRGTTDFAGFTEIIETTRPEQVGVHFMFKSPMGGRIEREDLTT